jgi:membrane fusion protein (multidrug efflux system)
MRVMFGAVLVACVIAVPAFAQQPQQPAAVPVGVVKAELKPVADTLEFVGRVDAINRVEVRARVKGFLEDVLFKEGDPVKERDPLYRIEKGLFQASVEQAQGALERSKASKALSEIQFQRAQELLDKNAGTVVARDQAKAADQQAQGQVLTDEANLTTAQINLGYTDITAPISGKISKTNVTKGNVVGPDSGVLTTIVSQDPMYVTFPVSQREFLRARERGYQVATAGITARLKFADGGVYEETGRINFIDVTVDRSTDTVLARASFPNPKGGLTDGQLVRVNLESGAPKDKLTIPQAALIADQEGVYVFVVEDGKAAVKRVKVGAESGTEVTIEQGLAAGDMVIVDGLQGVRPGAPVRANPLPASLSRS